MLQNCIIQIQTFFNTTLFQIKAKQVILTDDLGKSDNETMKLEEKRDGVKAIFDENKRKLPEAEQEAERAEDLANQVNEV